MKHPSTRKLFDYWNERRGRRIAPTSADIEPGAIRGALADTFILSGDPRRGHSFRIAGTRVCALFGREVKGEAFLDLWSVASRDEMRMMLAIVADESVGVVANATGMSAAGAALSLELLLLPLSYGRSDERMLRRAGTKRAAVLARDASALRLDGGNASSCGVYGCGEYSQHRPAAAAWALAARLRSLRRRSGVIALPSPSADGRPSPLPL